VGTFLGYKAAAPSTQRKEASIMKDWEIELKNKTQPFVAYKKCTSLVKTNSLKVKGWKKIF
jgi:hypothetical protein